MNTKEYLVLTGIFLIFFLVFGSVIYSRGTIRMSEYWLYSGYTGHQVPIHEVVRKFLE